MFLLLLLTKQFCSENLFTVYLVMYDSGKFQLSYVVKPINEAAVYADSLLSTINVVMQREQNKCDKLMFPLLIHFV